MSLISIYISCTTLNLIPFLKEYYTAMIFSVPSLSFLIIRRVDLHSGFSIIEGVLWLT